MNPHLYRCRQIETKTTSSMYGEFYAKMMKENYPISSKLVKVFQYVDGHRNGFMNDLKDAIAIKSISSNFEYRKEVKKMYEYVEKWLTELGVDYECFNIGTYEVDGKTYKLPPVILAEYRTSPKKKTICVYAHIDVKEPEECKWTTNPWEVTEVDNILYGNGVIDGKGPLMCWLHIMEAFLEENLEFPVNLKFIIEAMYHEGHEGLEEFLRRKDFLEDVNTVVICDSEWLGTKYPCLIYGSVGLLHFEISIKKLANTQTEIKDDMANIFNTIVDKHEKIIIPDFCEHVRQISPDEEKIYDNIKGFDWLAIKNNLPKHMQHYDKANFLMRFWRLPTIFVDDIQECACEPPSNSEIKRHFIIKIVPDQIISTCVERVEEHIKNVVKELKIENKVKLKVLKTSRPWVEDIMHPSYEAARRAMIQVFKFRPNLIREDRDREIATLLSVVSETCVLMLPMGPKGSNIGEENENLPKVNYYEGTKMLAAFLFQVAQVQYEYNE